jgi:uncharacterized protein YcbX
VPTVSLLSVTPVKGLALHHPDELVLGEDGVTGNRRFCLVRPTGKVFSGIDHGPLCRVTAAYDPERELLTLVLPDGTTVEGSGAGNGETLVADVFGRRVPGRVVDGPVGTALSDFVGKPLRLFRPDDPVGAYDVQPLTILSDASVDELRRRAGRREPLDARRFRMLVGLEGCEPHEEDSWGGRLLRVGEALLRVGGPVPRCATTTRSPDTGVRDFDTLRQVKAYRGLREGKHIDFGVYAVVVEPGRVRVGDPAGLEQGGGS